jgi:hypothetical protein
MKRTWWRYALLVLAAVIVAGGTIAVAVQQGSWTPVEANAWLPAVFVAVLPGRRRHSCLPRRGGRAAS